MMVLPIEVIVSIGRCMHTKLDVARFRALCRQIRSYIPPHEINKVPIQVRLRSIDSVYTFVKSTLYHLVQPASKASSSSSSSSSMEWIVKVREVKPENRCMLLHPLSTTLPLEPDSESFPDELNLLDFQVLELARGYSLRNSNSNEAEKKVVMSSDPQWHARMVMDMEKLYYYEHIENVEMQECTLVQHVLFEDQEINQDVIFYKSKFFVVGNYGTTVSIDSSLTVTHIASSLTCHRCSTNKLVESLGDLLLVKTCVSHGCKVYKLQELEKQWVEMKSLKKDRSLFEDDCISFSASTQEIPGCIGNHIFFSSDPYLFPDCFGANEIKLYVRIFMDSKAAVVELTINKYGGVGYLREHLDGADFPLPPHYLFMHRVSVMFEKKSLHFHRVPQVLHEQEEDAKVLVKFCGSQNCWEGNFNLKYQICNIYQDSPQFVSIWGVHEVYHELMTSRGPTFTRLEQNRKCYTYTNVRSGDILQIINYNPHKFDLKVNMIVDDEGTVVELEDMYLSDYVYELRNELKKKLNLPRQYNFVLLVQNAQYLMDEQVSFDKYLIHLKDVKYGEHGMIENGSQTIIAHVKVCPYVIINKNKRRRLSYNL